MLTPKQIEDARKQLGINIDNPSTPTADSLVSRLEMNQAKSAGYVDRLKTDFQGRQDEVKSINSSNASLPEKILQNVGQVAGGVVDIVSEAPGIKQGLDLVGGGIKKLSETAPIKVAGEFISPVTQKAVDTYKALPENIRKDIEAGINIASIIPVGEGTRGIVNAGIKAGEETANVAKTTAKTIKNIAGATKKVTGEIIPSADRVVNFQVSKALDLTAGDIKNINLSTGNEVGQFLADKNLIRGNKVETVKALSDFFDTNYKTVRNEISKVTKPYTVSSVPRYTDALKQIKKVIGDTPGLEKASVEVDNLLSNAVKGGQVTLNDVQKVKELLDEHFSLYKVTGDIKEGATKQGLTNMRKDLKQFIEKEVKKNTGADISTLNNEVSTAKSTLNAIEERSTKGLTASNIKMGDLGAFGVGSMFGGPLGGVAAVAGKKILGTSAVRLKFARWLDGISDARKLKIREELLKGKVPEDVSKLLNQSVSTPKASKINTIEKKVSIPKTIPKTSLKVKGEIPKQLNPLAKEAQKYKSAEVKLFHGTSKEIVGDIGTKNGLWLAEDSQIAQKYIGEGTKDAKGTVHVLLPKSKLKIFDAYEPSFEGKQTQTLQQLRDKYEKLGYDGVRVNDSVRYENQYGNLDKQYHPSIAMFPSGLKKLKAIK